MRRTSLAVLLFCATATAGLSAPPASRDGLTGKWTGKSICTNIRPACHDEVALYRITPANDDATASISFAKVVDGKEVVMGVLPFHVDDQNRVLSSEFEQRDIHALWTFAWTGTQMTGTLKLLPKGEVVRNIDLRKE